MTHRPPARRPDAHGPVQPRYTRPTRNLNDILNGGADHREPADRPDPWHLSAAPLPAGTTALIGLESTATRIREVSPLLIPGQLQTEGYARAVIIATTPERLTDDDVEARVRARVRRLTRYLDSGRTGEWVIGEAALLAPFGGPEILLGQLAHLAVLAKRPELDIRVLPLGAVGSPVQACTVYEQGDDRPIVYREQIGTSAYTTGLEEVDLHKYAVDRAQAAALSQADSRALMVQRWEDMWMSHGGGSRATPHRSTVLRSRTSIRDVLE